MAATFISELAEAIARHVDADGERPTSLPGLVLYRRSEPLARTPGIYRPSICVVAQGRKRMHYGENSHTYDPDNYLINSLTLPAEAEIPDASPEQPFLALILGLDRPMISRLMIDIDGVTGAPAAADAPGICTSSPLTERLRLGFTRLLRCLDDSLDSSILAPGLLYELHYEVLRGPHGYMLRNCVRNDSRSNRIAPIVHYIEENFRRSLDIESIAGFAGMSPSTLHQYFRDVTSMSPMQFVKRLRLHQARMLLLSGSQAGEACFHVGYGSPSQFSREFKRFFGDLPSEVARSNGVSTLSR
jgi:AraC-like DNA-binding protein